MIISDACRKPVGGRHKLALQVVLPFWIHDLNCSSDNAAIGPPGADRVANWPTSLVVLNVNEQTTCFSSTLADQAGHFGLIPLHNQHILDYLLVRLYTGVEFDAATTS